jgi:hypothetical protein
MYTGIMARPRRVVGNVVKRTPFKHGTQRQARRCFIRKWKGTLQRGVSRRGLGGKVLFRVLVVWALLVPARAACQAAVVAACAATEAADAAAAAAVADHEPPAAPSIVAARAVTAAAVDLAFMSSAEERALLAKLGNFMGDEQGTSVREPPESHVTCACLLSLTGALVWL